MEIKKEQSVIIKLVGDDAKHFSSAIDKIAKGDTRIGFSKTELSDDEQKVIKAVSKEL